MSNPDPFAGWLTAEDRAVWSSPTDRTPPRVLVNPAHVVSVQDNADGLLAITRGRTFHLVGDSETAALRAFRAADDATDPDRMPCCGHRISDHLPRGAEISFNRAPCVYTGCGCEDMITPEMVAAGEAPDGFVPWNQRVRP